MIRPAFRPLFASLVVALLLLTPFAVGAQEPLTETYTDPDTGLIVHYPAGWVTQGEMGGLMLGNSPAALEQVSSGLNEPTPGTLVIMLGPASTFVPSVGTTPLEVAGQMVNSMTGDVSARTPPVEVTLNNVPAARFTAESVENNGELIGYVVPVGDELFAVVGVGRLSEMAQFQPTIEAIASQIEQGEPPPRPAARPIAYGETVQGTITSDRGEEWTFTGAAGDVVSITGEALNDTLVELHGPDGTLVDSDDDSGGNLNPAIESVTLPQSGAYTLVYRAYSVGTVGMGYSMTLTLEESGQAQPVTTPVSPPPGPVTTSAGSITPGQTVSGTITNASGERWSLAGNQGDVVSVAVESLSDTVVELRGADESVLATDDDSGGNLNPLITQFALPSSGTFTIVVRAYGGATGVDYELTVTQITVRAPGPIAYGETVQATIGKGAGDQWTFTGEAGDIVSIAMTSDFDNYLHLKDASGADLDTDDDSGGSLNALISGYALPETGTYRILARPLDNTTLGPYTLSLTEVIQGPPVAIEYGQVIRGNLELAVGDIYTFQGTEDDVVSIVMSGTFGTELALYGPDEELIAQSEYGEFYSTSLLEEVTLPATGQYRLVAGSDGGLGTYVLMIGHPMPEPR